jgi:pyruvate kinase
MIGRNRKTKIVATIGPASWSPQKLQRLVREGIDAIRLNFSHGEHEEHGRCIRLIRALEKRAGRPIAIIADLQGPKMRVGTLPDGGMVLREGDTVTLDTSSSRATAGTIPLPSPVFAEGVKKGAHVLLDDGALSLEIVTARSPRFVARVHRGGRLLSNKGVNVPLLELRRSILEKKDRADMAFAAAAGVDFVALSFIRSAKDVMVARRSLGNSGVKLIAKIERPEALENLSSIIDEADAVMVARGDLGIETPLWELPVRQKEIVRLAHRKGKPVIVATQLLDSMMRNPVPTRAEVSDVANAALDRADAVMLSGETASGPYPTEAVRLMRRVLESAESTIRRYDLREEDGTSVTDALAKSARYVAADIGAKVIIAGTVTGASARAVSRNRPQVPVIAAAAEPAAARQLALVWGIRPIIVRGARTPDQIASRAVATLARTGEVRRGDRVVFLCGRRIGIAGQTNVLSVIVVS